MIPDTEKLIARFWAVAGKHTVPSRPNRFCQCFTENIICDYDDRALARAFLLVSITINQAMRHNPFCDYESFSRQFSFPTLDAHQGGGEAGAEWVVYSYYGWDKKMDWHLGASLFCQLSKDIRKWLSNFTWGEAAFWHLLLQSKHLVPLFAKHDKDASNSLLGYLEPEVEHRLLYNVAELRERPDLVMHLLGLCRTGGEIWDSVVCAGTKIASDNGDGNLALELTKVVGSNTQHGHELLDILRQTLSMRKDAKLALRVARYLNPSDPMRSFFIDYLATLVRSSGDGLMALDLWKLTTDGDTYHGEALGISLNAAIVSDSTDLLYGVSRAIGSGHPSYPDLIIRFLSVFRTKPCQSVLEQLLLVLDEEHLEYYSVLELASSHGLHLSEDHRRRKKAEAARKRANMHQQHLLRQKAKSNERHDHLNSMSHWQPIERLKYIASGSRPLTYFPVEWADVQDRDIIILSGDVRKALIEKLRTVRKGPWRTLMIRIFKLPVEKS